MRQLHLWELALKVFAEESMGPVEVGIISATPWMAPTAKKKAPSPKPTSTIAMGKLRLLKKFVPLVSHRGSLFVHLLYL